MDTLIQDIHYGFRTLLKTPGVTAIAVLSLALGIGANTAIFSIVNALMLRALPVRDPHSLALIGHNKMIGITDDVPGRSLDLISVAEWKELRKHKELFEDAAGVFSLPLGLRASVAGASKTEALKARAVTGNYFTMLGVPASAGRVFNDTVDDASNAHAEVILSDTYWKRRFGRNPNAVGQPVKIGQRIFTIIGVAAPEFFGTEVGESPDLWVPVSMQSEIPPYLNFYNEKMAHELDVIVRTNPRVSLNQAAAGTTLLIHQLLRSYKGATISPRERQDLEKTFVELTPAAAGLSQIRNRFSVSLNVLMGVVALVLLIAAANVANLLLGRATAREREMAIRMAVGSSRVRVIRQLLTESLILSCTGAAFGILFAMWGSDLLVQLVSNGPDRIPLNVNPDGHVLAFTIIVALLTGLVFGIAPAFRSSGVDVNAGLREGRNGTATHSRMFVSRALVVVQVALSLLLVVGAGLFIRSLNNLEQVDPGFNRDNVLAFELDTNDLGYKQDARLGALYSRIEDRVKRVPGVDAASLIMMAFNQGEMSSSIAIEGKPEILAAGKSALVNVTGPNYLATTGIPLVAGRFFTAHDTAASQKVAVINETAAREIFKGTSAIGKRMSFGEPEHGYDIEIVGVVKDIKNDSVTEKQRWALYQPFAQRNEFLGNLLVRTNHTSSPLIGAVRRAVAEVEPNLPIPEVLTMRTMVDRSLITQQLIAQISGFFGALALLLAAIGLYGVLSYSVVRRTPEIGIRMALGAQTARVLWMVLRETLILVGLGVAIGLPLALLSSRLVETMLYGLKSNDTLTLLSGTIILLAIGAFAGWLPARRASKVDPMIALRYE